MTRKFIFIALTILAALQVQALEVVNTAGHLSEKVKNHDITDLIVSGTMDANDFYFIVEKLSRLKTIDISQAEVLACQTGKMHYWVRNFAAGVLPAGAFADGYTTQGWRPSSAVNQPASMAASGKMGAMTMSFCSQRHFPNVPRASATSTNTSSSAKMPETATMR